MASLLCYAGRTREVWVLASLTRDVNKGFDVETLLVPARLFAKMPELLDSAQTQADIPLAS